MEMPESEMSAERVARRADEIYERSIRHTVETDENIGKMVIVDVETGDYAVDETGIESARRLREHRSGARLFGIKIGYKVAEAFGGALERTARK